jgi:dolichol kinase
MAQIGRTSPSIDEQEPAAMPPSSPNASAPIAAGGDTPALARNVARNPLNVVMRLPGAEWAARRLGQAELRRRLLHMVPGLLPLVLWAYPHQYPDWEPQIRVWVAGLAMLLAFFGLQHFQSVARRGESAGLGSVLGYSFAVLGALAVAPRHPEYSLIVLTILAFGDGSATLGGMLIGGPRLFWNRQKTWAGLLCFAACGTVVAAFTYWAEVKPTPEWSAAFMIGASVATAAALAESLPMRVNDNFRVGIVTLVACFAVVEHEFRPLKMLCIGTAVVALAFWTQRRRSGSVQ